MLLLLRWRRQVLQVFNLFGSAIFKILGTGILGFTQYKSGLFCNVDIKKMYLAPEKTGWTLEEYYVYKSYDMVYDLCLGTGQLSLKV